MVPIKELVQTNYFILLYLFFLKTGLALQSKSSLGLNLWDLCDAKLLQVMSPANSIKAETDIELPAAGQRGSGLQDCLLTETKHST